jgi:RNA recognition motif-containing protein
MKSALEKFLKLLVVIVFITVASFTSFTSPASATIYVKNLPNDATKSDIESLFKPYGLVERATLLNKKTGEFSGLATVNLVKLNLTEIGALITNALDDEEKAIKKLNGTEWRGHTLSVADKPSKLK